MTTPPPTPVSSTPTPTRAAAWFGLAGGKHALVLGGFSLAATLLLALAHGLTKAPIEQSALEDLRHSLEQVIPASIHDNNPATDTMQLQLNGTSLQVYRARKASHITGVAFEVSRKGYSGDIRVLLGVDENGKLLGVRVLKHTETPGLGDKIEVARSDWITRFTGLSLGNPPQAKWAVKKDGGAFDQFAGATITPRAVVNGVKDGLQLFAAHRKNLLEEVPK
ncbi:MAG: electron transport complex subunit RsxG [Rhodoferax sp.]|uniref:electron transport complex subunit RsxG n=1 Tax=Rhodoferax sp. TaxID=50421 RepID=UPI000A8A333B|nr:electron transport complex subunit RsxG [Rhodoferax sp.]MDP2681096.1 electron transport complex subunit RsxG [Rhodoferax sp.]